MNDILNPETPAAPAAPATPNIPETPAAPETPAQPTDQIPGWLQNVQDDNLKNDQTLRRFKDPHNLAVSYLEIRRKLGDNPIVKPADSDPPEKWNEYYKALGRPETPEAYSFTEMEGVPADEKVLGEFRKTAHELGLTGTQADKLNLWVGELAKKTIADQKIFFENQRRETETTLRKEWSGEYESNVKLATKALKIHAGEGLTKVLADAGIINHIEVVKFFHKLGLQTSEDKLKGVGDSANASQTKYTRAQLEKMMMDERYRNPMKRDQAFIAEVERGFKELYPGQTVVAMTERGEGRAQ